MGSIDVDEGNVPWGKYTYALECLATGCYLEGACDKTLSQNSHSLRGQRLRFRVELPARCFVLSVAVKLPNAPKPALVALEHVEIERTLSNGEYETVYDASLTAKLPPKSPQHNPSNNQSIHTQLAPQKSSVEPSDPSKHGSPTSVDQTSVKPQENDNKLSRKKVMEVRRAADSLRLTIRDIDEDPKPSSTRRRSSTASDNDSDASEFRTLGVVVVGYVRGQTPASNRIKILLNSSAKLGLHTAKADRAEVDGLLGLAFLGNRRYRQAAELLQRASELVIDVAQEDVKAGCSPEEEYSWAAELNLLSAYAYFEHMPKSNDGILRLIHVANAAKMATPRNSRRQSREPKDLVAEFLDLRTELLVMLEDLMTMLVQFLGESTSLAVKLASASMIEFVCEQLGCAVAKHLSLILNQVLRLYPDCMTFGPRERAAAASFSYDSMEDCFERLIDLCCRLFPLTEHGVLHKLYDNTLVPVFLDGFHESKYLCFDGDVEEEADELTTAAVAQTARVIYLVLNVVGADARVPASLVGRILNILITDNGRPRTPLLLRRTALHTWDALCKALVRSAKGNTIKVFAQHIKVLHDYIPRLLVDTARPSFEYGDVEDEGESEIEIIKEEYVTSEGSVKLKKVFQRRQRRTEIVDRHTLRRLLSILHDVCEALNTSEEDEERYTEVIVALQDTVSHSIANLLMSGLIDVSYHEAVASGNGLDEGNNTLEFGDISTQLNVASDILEQLFETYWASLRVLPKTSADEALRTSSIHSVLGWCVDRMRYSAPPKGMLKLLFVMVKGLQTEVNTRMYSLPSVEAAPYEVTFISIYRAFSPWFAQSTCEEAFDLMDSLLNAVEHDLMATDLSRLIQALGDQTELFQSRTDVSLELLAGVVASIAPKRPDLALSSLKALEDPSAGNQRIANGFPKTNRSNTGSFTRRLQLSSGSRSEPMSKSLYVHVVLASCFDRFDALARASRHKAGPSYMGEKIDAFVEHAALCVRCLHACARARKHRDYIAAVLGDVFSTCLAMQAHNDGRVRLAGFEIFAASLDVLFLAQETKVLLPQQSSMANSEMAIMKVSSGAPGSVLNGEAMNSVTELSSQQDRETHALRSVPSGGNDPGLDLVRSNSLPASLIPPKLEDWADTKKEEEEADDDTDIERKMHSIFEEGGSCSFQGEEASSTDFAHEEKAWQMLCAFVHSSLGIGKYVDVVVQRACLEYLKGCMLSALGGKSTGASVIGFEHIELLWESVNRLVGSPWRALSGLAMWVMCAIVNVAIYCSVMVKGKGAIRQRSEKLHDFAFQNVFPKVESFLKHGSRETRIWGMRVLEVYIKARDLNNGIIQTVPPPPYDTLRTLENLKNDWDGEVRSSCESLRETNNTAKTRKSSYQTTSFTAQAQNFMSMKRYHLNDVDGSESSRIELWFPALPSQPLYLNVDLYCRTLEGFANAEIEGGEETEVVPVEEVCDENEDEYEAEYEEDEESYEFDEEDREESLDVTDDDGKQTTATTRPEEISAEEISRFEEDSLSAPPQEHFDNSAIVHQEDSETLSSGYNTSEESSNESRDSATTNSVSLERSMESSTNLSSSSDEDIDDFEFATSEKERQSSHGSSSAPSPDTLVKDEDGPAVGTMVNKNEAAYDLVDEEEVVNVTDDDDILADLDSISSDEKQPKHASGLSQPSEAVALTSRHGSQGDDNMIKRQEGSLGGSSSSGPKPELNPDLDEGVQVLRRRGSFTSRPTPAMPSEEGEIPKLARRRSLDVASSIIGTGGESKNSRGDVDVSSPGPIGSRLSRKRSGRSSVSSPRDEVKPGDGGTEVDIERKSPTGDSSEQASPPANITLKKKLSKGLSGSAEGLSKNSLQETLSVHPVGDSQSRGETSENPSSIANPEDHHTEAPESHPLTSPNPPRIANPEKPRSKSRLDSKSSHSRPIRRLPRAPAFWKGAGPQRRIPAPLPIGSPLGEGKDRKAESNLLANASSDGASTPAHAGSNSGQRQNLMPGRSQAVKAPRSSGTAEADSQERRSNRSHRFSRREPLRLPIGDADAEEPDKELLDDLESGLDEIDGLGNRMRVGTPTAESLNGRRSLADGEPSGRFKQRSVKRDITDSEHYRSLVDQGIPGDEQRNSGADGHRGEGQNLASSKRDASTTQGSKSGRGNS